jgi:uncharacterized protein (TIGR02391 family)
LTIAELVPSADDLLALETEELAGVLLEHLNATCPSDPSPQTNADQPHRHNFFIGLRSYPTASSQINYRVALALMEAWSWLERENFMAVRAGFNGAEDYFITRRGRRVKSRTGLDSYRKANLLPRARLHPSIAERVYPAFLWGEYDTAIFQAFREVEVAVRDAGKYPPDTVGMRLMREAFRPAQGAGAPGPLTDTVLPVAEQEGMMNLFVGAIGLYNYKNPQSHRNVPAEALDAAEVIIFASHLLRLVDRRAGLVSETRALSFLNYTSL